MSITKLLETDFIDEIEKKAYIKSKQMRKKFVFIFDFIKKFCIDNKLIISDVNKICGIKDELNMIINIYSTNPLKYSNLLINKLFLDLKNKKYLKLSTIQKNEEFMLYYNFKPIVIFNKLHKFRETKIILPKIIDNLQYLPSNIEIIDIYKSLYDINQFSDYDKNLKIEKILFNDIESNKEKNILGSGKCDKFKRDIVDAIKIYLVKKWIRKNNNIILIGAWAHDWYKNRKNICTNNEKVQIITNININNIFVELENEINKISTKKIHFRKNIIGIPKDPYTIRYTFYINFQTIKGITEKPFLDIFNSTEHNLIPNITIDKVKLGTKFVILRYLFIDIWILKFILEVGKLPRYKILNKIHIMWKYINFFKNNYEIDIKKIEFNGIFQDHIIYKKNKNINNIIFPYYPYIYNNKYNSLRKI